MLQELSITDFAIISQVRLQFTGGLVIFTGETGAGKSIVLDAIGAILGDRVGADVVRSGASRAIVEGIFALPWLPELLHESEQPSVAQSTDGDAPAEPSPDPRHRLVGILREFGLEGDDDTLIVTREIGSTGRSVARVNGRTIPINVLARIGELLVDVHGQGAHLALLHPERHVDYLDRAGETMTQRAALAQQVREWQAMRREVQTLRRDERELERRAELLRYQADEINSAKLRPGEIDDLEREQTVLANAERLGEMSDMVHAALNGADGGETSGAIDLLSTAQRTLGDLARIDASLAETLANFEESLYRLEDVASTLRDYRDRAEADPERLAEIDDRLNLITRLRRKYGATIEEIIAYGEQASAELEQIEHRDERIADLEDQIERQRSTLGKRAETLSTQRRQAATVMSAAMEAALDTLNMRQARFLVQMERQPAEDGVILSDGERVAITPTGIDRVEFLIAPNPGEPPRPLARIASGGETSRLMLALKSILAGADATPTLIFDEIDSGISGLTGQIVGEMLWKLGQDHQVICVTHLPQLAAFGDQHWHVAKRIVDDRTSTVVTSLDAAARTLEIAQMLGGIATESAARNAAELLDRAGTWKVENSPKVASNGHSEQPDKRTAKRKPSRT